MQKHRSTSLCIAACFLTGIAGCAGDTAKSSAPAGEVQERAVMRDQRALSEGTLRPSKPPIVSSPTPTAPAPSSGPTGPLPVVGGINEPDYKYPWVVRMNGCAGVLIDPQWVLTGTRKGGSNSSIIVRFDVQPDAAPGERTVKMRYAIETNGPDTFKIRVVRRGNVSRIQYRRPLPFRPGGGPSSELVAPVNLPLNDRVVLIVTGTRLTNIGVRPHSAFRNVRVLSGTTDTQAAIEIEFSQSGQGPLFLFDSVLSTQEMNASTSSQFLYTGGANLNIQYGGTASAGGRIIPPPIVGGVGSGPTPFVDVAARANMVNVFRRQQPGPAFTLNGAQYFSIDSQVYCNEMTGNQSQVITVPNPVWGVSNVGTGPVTTPFVSQLRSGNQVLSTQTVPGLNPGQTVDFTFTRPNDSRVRVSTFLNRIGCFISPSFNPFFEDPPFTVVVNTNGAVTEAAANQANNSRNY